MGAEQPNPFEARSKRDGQLDHCARRRRYGIDEGRSLKVRDKTKFLQFAYSAGNAAFQRGINSSGERGNGGFGTRYAPTSEAVFR